MARAEPAREQRRSSRVVGTGVGGGSVLPAACGGDLVVTRSPKRLCYAPRAWRCRKRCG